LFQVTAATVGAFEPEESTKLHRLGDNPAVATLTPAMGEPVRVAVTSEHCTALLGPYGSTVGEG
jgi:hypothetical protein